MQITPTTPHLGCVIMASGLGKRFGGNKLMADFDGQPLICRALTVTDGPFFTPRCCDTPCRCCFAVPCSKCSCYFA